MLQLQLPCLPRAAKTIPRASLLCIDLRRPPHAPYAAVCDREHIEHSQKANALHHHCWDLVHGECSPEPPARIGAQVECILKTDPTRNTGGQEGGYNAAQNALVAPLVGRYRAKCRSLVGDCTGRGEQRKSSTYLVLIRTDSDLSLVSMYVGIECADGHCVRPSWSPVQCYGHEFDGHVEICRPPHISRARSLQDFFAIKLVATKISYYLLR